MPPFPLASSVARFSSRGALACAALGSVLAGAVLFACGGDSAAPSAAPGGAPAAASVAVAREPFPGEEKHLKNIRQLTFQGENAEAYWSFAGDKLVFMSTRPPYPAYQIYTMNPDGTDARLVSTGKGTTTCAFFMPGDRRIVYASTHAFADAPPPKPDKSKGYVWGLFEYDLFTCDLDGKNLARLTDSPGYDAEATVSPKGDRIVFTSSRDHDLDVYTCALDGSDVKRLTTEVGYDGGPVWSPDGKQIAYRAQHVESDTEKEDFRALLARGLVRPTRLDLFVMDADGGNKRQVTNYKKASFAPFFSHDGKKLIFSSNVDDSAGRSFDLYLVDLDGKNLERVTTFTTPDHDDFDGFPMFSPDGKKLVWCSNRNHSRPHQTNVFVADWVESGAVGGR